MKSQPPRYHLFVAWEGLDFDAVKFFKEQAEMFTDAAIEDEPARVGRLGPAGEAAYAAWKAWSQLTGRQPPVRAVDYFGSFEIADRYPVPNRRRR